MARGSRRVDSAGITSLTDRITAPISVVIPAYNAETFLADAIQSVHGQTLNVAEIIVVADSCSDRTEQIATKLGANVLTHHARNMAAGLNLGVRSSSQPWIALLDADDIWKEEKIELQWKMIQTRPEAGLVACDMFTVQGENVTHLSEQMLRERWDDIQYVEVGEHSYFVEKIPGRVLPSFTIPTPTAMLRRDVFSTAGFFDETLIFGQSLEFFARVLAHYPLLFVERPLVYHRRHADNHTRNLDAYRSMYISIINRMLQHPERYPPGTGEAYRASLKRDFHQFERGLLKQKRKAIT